MNNRAFETIARILYPFILLFAFLMIVGLTDSHGAGQAGGLFAVMAVILSETILEKKHRYLFEKETRIMWLRIALAALFLLTVMMVFTKSTSIGVKVATARLILQNMLFNLAVATGLIAVYVMIKELMEEE
ncbi:MAG: hypothetical protein JW803_03010 [Endomicrobiales bacterium]|nr:hypothetical protein [Endomicrobiales bacterium]